jgi:hypothetical protein
MRPALIDGEIGYRLLVHEQPALRREVPVTRGALPSPALAAG